MSGNFYVYFVEFQTQNLLLEAVRCHCLPQMMQNTRISTRRRLYEGRGWGERGMQSLVDKLQTPLFPNVKKLSFQVYSAPYTLSKTEGFYCVTSHLTEKLSKTCSLTGNSARLRTVLSSRLWHTELRSSLRESHSFLSLPADTTMASPQGTTASSNSFSRWASHDIRVFLFKYNFLLHI